MPITLEIYRCNTLILNLLMERPTKQVGLVICFGIKMRVACSNGYMNRFNLRVGVMDSSMY